MQPKDPAQLLRAVGRRISELRAEGGETQEEFAERYGVSPAYVRLIERGAENLTLTSLFQLSRALGTTVEALLQPPKSLRANPGRPRKRSR